tara:strand:- start:364 stop:573 length:210 start_codon:yes stop_codon:yes gene_type:complete
MFKIGDCVTLNPIYKDHQIIKFNGNLNFDEVGIVIENDFCGPLYCIVRCPNGKTEFIWNHYLLKYKILI